MYSRALVEPDRRDVEVGRGARGTNSGNPAKSPRRSAPAAPNCDVRGLPFLFREGQCRIIADSTGRVLWISQRASGLVSENACIAIVDGKLTGRTRHNGRLIQALLADSAQSDGAVDQLFSRAANEVPELFVRARSSTERDPRVIALTIRQLSSELHGIPDLTRLYGLTPTEKQITELMLQGMSVTAIAEQLCNSVLTVRTHIKRAYVKLNVGTKEQLFSTIIRLMVD